VTAGVLRLKNPVRHYAWGSRTAIPGLMGLELPAPEPWAELWIGAHPAAPSRVGPEAGSEALDAFIARDPVAVLGAETARRFHGRLPFLLKLLAAEQPLSLQAHPDAEQARQGFARDNARGLAPDAPERCYRDDRPKPELVMALTPFRALNRFRSPLELAGRLAAIEAPALEAPLETLRARPDRAGLAGLFAALWGLGEAERGGVLDAAVRWAQRQAPGDAAARCLLELAGLHPQDPAVLAPLLLQLVELQPGEAMFLPAGELHAYLEGTAVEIMGSSDNVLRGGLTSKHVDVDELGRTLTFASGPVEKLLPRPAGEGVWCWQTPAEEFELSRIEVRPGRVFRSGAGREVEILLCLEGSAVLRGPGEHSIARGESLLVAADVPAYAIDGHATLFRASPGRSDGPQG